MNKLKELPKIPAVPQPLKVIKKWWNTTAEIPETKSCYFNEDNYKKYLTGISW